jgi:tRNA pseudouridine13 synthase
MTNESNQGGTLPFVTADLPGLGGRIKSAPEDFVVEEIPAYEPCGKGDLLYVRLTREGWPTKALADRLKDIFGRGTWMGLGRN